MVSLYQYFQGHELQRKGVSDVKGILIDSTRHDGPTQAETIGARCRGWKIFAIVESQVLLGPIM